MKKQVIILKNIYREGPGIFENILREQNVDFRLVETVRDKDFPSFKNCRALVVLGGSESANDSSEKILKEISYVQKALSLKIPYLGICLGLQILVKAAGGAVVRSPVKEIGFRDYEGNYFEVELTEEGKIDPLFERFPERFKIFQLHSETVELSQSMRLLGRGKLCHNQVIKAGKNAYGIQGHLEVTREMLGQWMEEDSDLMKLDSEKLTKDFEKINSEYIEIGRKLFQNFLKLCGF